MSPIQQMLLGVGAVAAKTYVDDIFSTYIYEGTGSAGNQVNNGIDVSGEGGMVWIKPRASGYHYVVDSERNSGAGILNPNTADANANNGNLVSSLNSNGFTLGSLGNANTDGDSYASWTFRKSPGFFDVVTYTGDGNTSQQISHSLACVPGMVIVKCTSNESASMSWYVYHRMRGNTNGLYLNGVGPGDTNSGFWNNTSPTSTHFTVSDADPDAVTTNKDGATYVAYVFGDVSSKETTSRSVYFDGSSDYLLSTSSDYSPGTGDFTMEAWVNIESGVAATDGIFQLSSTSGAFTYGGIALLYKKSASENRWELYGGNSTNQSESTAFTGYEYGQWVHTAIVKTSGNIKLYINGEERISAADTQDYSGYQYLGLGAAFGSTYNFKGNISNFKLTIGQALYTSAFTPTNEPLTTTSQSSTASNVKILCCNNSSVTGKTVGATITSNGTVTASTDNPNFIDTAASIFGESGDQGVIKCGSYVGNGNADGPEINLGWEPSWLLIKRSSGTEDWMLFDNIRTSDRTDMHLDDLRPNKSNAEGDGAGGDSNSFLNWTSTGFKLQSNTAHTNDDDDTYIFCAIRRPDGYVGKPPELGTDVFAMDTGSDSSTIPTYDSGFPVDFSISRTPASSGNWFTGARFMPGKTLYTNTTERDSNRDFSCYDSNVGFDKDTWGPGSSTYQAWMWRRHAGFDVVAYGNGTSAARRIPHSLSKVPEMIWVKKRDSVEDWAVYHKGLNGGSSPEDYYLNLNNTNAEVDASSRWNDTAPTATHFTVGTSASVNGTNGEYLAMLFASTDVSKVGSYVGNDSGSNREISLGFQPRFLILMLSNSGGGYGWYVFDTKRGWASGSNNAPYLKLESTAAESDEDHMYPTSNGFMITENAFNGANQNWIYYAHA